MPTTFERATGQATIAGATIIAAVPAGTTRIPISVRASNLDSTTSEVWLYIGSTLINGLNTKLPVGSSLDIGKFVMKEGDVLTAYSDKDNQVDIHVSYLEQT